MGRRPIAGGYDEKSVGRAIVGKPTLSPFPGHSGPHTFAFLSCVWRARGIISMPPLFDDVMSNGRQCRIVQATSGRHKALFLDSTDSRGRRVHKCLSTDPQKRISVVADVLRLRPCDLPESLVSLLSEHAGEPQYISHAQTHPPLITPTPSRAP
jgi:hypothetical protein